MKVFVFFALTMLAACTNENNIEPNDAIGKVEDNKPKEGSAGDFSNQKLLLEGKFVDGGHPTSGIAKIYEAKDGKRTLVFENLKSDPGPDLRIYIANDKAVTNFTEISNMVSNGNKSYELPSGVDLSKQKFVLIWCKKFAVLFGHAELK